MRNIRLTLEYCGKNYAGWQRQNSSQFIVHSSQKKTIQEVLEKTLRKILQEKVKLIASGRTDAGVHALAQAANFKTHSQIPLAKLRLALNSLLPEDIAVKKIEEAPLNFHSRFQAKSKTYSYLILNQPYRSAFLKDYAYFFPWLLNIKLMRKEARCLLGKHDFKSFCASGSSIKDTVRTIKRLSIKKSSCHLSPVTYHLNHAPLIIIGIEADGFLYNMVRNIVGTLIEIGRGKLPEGSMERILSAKDRKLAGPTAPACGLCLMKVRY